MLFTVLTDERGTFKWSFQQMQTKHLTHPFMAEYITHLRYITHLCEKLFSMLGRKEKFLSLCVYKILIRLWSELYLWCLAEFWLSISRNKISIMKNIWNSWKEMGFGGEDATFKNTTSFPIYISIFLDTNAFLINQS